ncbi:MAG: calcium-binding protein, partial [Solirubrobacteraceae bacterium]
MRLGPAAVVVASLVMAFAAATANAVPSAAFDLRTSQPCVAGTCRALLSYDVAGLLAAVKVEVDWDARDSPGGFQPDHALDCAPALPDDVDYEPVPCEASSPVFRVPGTAQVAVRVTDSVDGTQATATQPLFVAAARGGKAPQPGGATVNLCAPRQAGVQCGPGNGRQTSGGGDKVPHKGWPAVTGILWKVLDNGGHKKVGGPDNDELLGHHGSDRLFGGEGKDILWGDWDPSNNNTRQKDLLDGGPGNDWIYPSHGSTVVKGGPGKDYVWAYYGRGTIDCGSGNDTARVKLNGPWTVRNCERILHFCAFGSDGHGGCLTPGEKKATATRRGRGAGVAAR